ncbi:cytochrome ubiquinol oxidase subunit II [Vandammella animalimorsus]|uniref:Cytochrome ubiquinol oxidase subunit II n=2 Tax=Vandammella animalimorsus TaxID=2029117 RepID=A0A2A2B015_9BURK|nr:cytochrome ubiquinol oxidase subunit II [Vandammella animalimorsus]PAT43272.1 cytochrome ubiquinol oxidase subunit II [Vandammella animalimorsus]
MPSCQSPIPEVCMKKLTPLAALLLVPLLLTGCDWTLINPSGYVAKQQSNLMIFSVLVMLLVIVPVMFLILFFSWKYRQSNQSGTYDSGFYHSNKLEVVIWGAPICIIIVLALVTWGSTYLLDPYRPLVRIDSQTKIAGMEENLGAVKTLATRFIDPKRSDEAVVETTPLEIEVAALDWKWLFIYPEQGIATVNELAAPVNRPIRFKITSASMMNSFFIPALSGQVYAMPAMQTQLNAVMNREGKFKGFSANYTGHGFSQMYFYFHSLSNAGFDQWVEKVRSSTKVLDQAEYMALDQYNQKDERGHVQYFGIRHYGSVQQGMYHAILNLCVMPGAMCMDEMMGIDLAGGAGIDSLNNLKRLRYDMRRTTKAQLDLAEFSGMMPGDLVCTSDSAAVDFVRATRKLPALKPVMPTAQVEQPGSVQGQKLSRDGSMIAPIL